MKSGPVKKSALASAYAAKRSMKAPMGCSECMAAGGKCYAHGGSVENPEMAASHSSASMAPHELVDEDLRGAEESSMDEKDSPQVNEHISLSEAIMKDRRRLMMAKGGKVGSEDGPIDAPHMSDMDNDQDEMDAPYDDGRETRGLNLEPVHTMEDDEHDTSDASLVSQILMDRKKRRSGM